MQYVIGNSIIKINLTNFYCFLLVIIFMLSNLYDVYNVYDVYLYKEYVINIVRSK